MEMERVEMETSGDGNEPGGDGDGNEPDEDGNEPGGDGDGNEPDGDGNEPGGDGNGNEPGGDGNEPGGDGDGNEPGGDGDGNEPGGDGDGITCSFFHPEQDKKYFTFSCCGDSDSLLQLRRQGRVTNIASYTNQLYSETI